MAAHPTQNHVKLSTSVDLVCKWGWDDWKSGEYPLSAALAHGIAIGADSIVQGAGHTGILGSPHVRNPAQVWEEMGRWDNS